jgi:acyl-CoA synthetase (NDP forming)
VLTEPEVYALLVAAGIGVPTHRMVADADDVDDSLVQSLGSEEVVVKVVSPDVLHKSDVGGVMVVRNGRESIRRAVVSVLASVRSQAASGITIHGALISERVRFASGLGREILAGFRHDHAFGAVVVVGVGGLDAEVLLGSLHPRRARAARRAEGLGEVEARRMLRGLLVGDAFGGRLRGPKVDPGDETALADLLCRLASLARRTAGFACDGGVGLAELELNPVVLSTEGRMVALDGLARLHRPLALPPPRPISRIRHLLEPRSAVVIGASAEGSNPGRVMLRNLVEGGGVPKERVVAVHPRADAIDGCRAYRSVVDLPETVDLAIVALPADRGASAVEELARTQRARAVTLIAGGFAETAGGRGAEEKVREAVVATRDREDGGLLLNGGNCLGIISVPGGYSTFFLPKHKLPLVAGPLTRVASVSQSGAYLVSQISNLAGVVRLRYAISFGNQADLTVSDYLDYLKGDADVDVVVAYVEGFRPGDGSRFLDSAAALTASGRRVLLYKAGRTREGGAAAASHTAAAVGDYDICRDLAAEAGVVVVPTLDVFDDFVVTFAALHGRGVSGKRIAVLSNGGFECTGAADSLGRLVLADLAPATRSRLTELLPAGVVDVHNPLDVTPVTDTGRYVAAAEVLLADESVDGLVLAGLPQTPALDTLAAGPGHGEDVLGPRGLATRLLAVFRGTGKPMVVSVDAGPLYDPLVDSLRQEGLPCVRKVDRAVRCLEAFVMAECEKTHNAA